MKNTITLHPQLFFDFNSHTLIFFKDPKESTPQLIKLDYKLAGMLNLLLKNKEQLVERKLFITELWEENFLVGEKALNRNISRLRSLLKEHGLIEFIQIKTVPKKGYILNIITRPSNLIKTPFITQIGNIGKKLVLPLVIGLSFFFLFIALTEKEEEIREEDDIYILLDDGTTMETNISKSSTNNSTPKKN